MHGDRSRLRGIKGHNNECGTPCEGSLEENKKCERACERKQDCVFSDWSRWSLCEVPWGQKQRIRQIKTYPNNGGLPCEGALNETAHCLLEPNSSTKCVFSAWGARSACSAKCDGLQTRIRRAPANKACHGCLEELQGCGLTCPPAPRRDCKYGVWAEWSYCDGENEQTREREITQFASGGGTSCTANLTIVRRCERIPIDCVISNWTAWDHCDVPCGGGQHQRHRFIQKFPMFGGKSCPEDVLETQGCNMAPCPNADCKLCEWSDWTPCSQTCGEGQTSRFRTITEHAKHGGRACEGVTRETIPCTGNAECPWVDCKWGDWSLWSECSRSCGGGNKGRTRDIADIPTRGGKQCDASKKEVIEPCNTHRCDDMGDDGQWSDWSGWGTCSATCKAGVQARTRNVAKWPIGSGTGPFGFSHETRFCNYEKLCLEDLNCRFGDWQEWSNCNRACFGMRQREREIKHYGHMNGTYCVGGLSQLEMCNPALPNDPAPTSCPNFDKEESRDCTLSEWDGWSSCSHTCGGGQQKRCRHVTQEATNGGKPCNGELKLVRECGRAVCPGSGKVDCKLSDWGEWCGCKKPCGGHTDRKRHITRWPARGGAACEHADMMQLHECPNACPDSGFCAFNQWQQWGACTTTCGYGHRPRHRYLVWTTNKSKERPESRAALIQELEELTSKAASAAMRDPKDLVAAFTCGGVTLALAMLAFRAFSSMRADRLGHQFERVELHDVTRETEIPLTSSVH